MRSEAALIGGLELGKDQLAAGIGLLRANDVEPAIQVAQFEMASVDREGDVGAKFDALSSYWKGSSAAGCWPTWAGSPRMACRLPPSRSHDSSERAVNDEDPGNGARVLAASTAEVLRVPQLHPVRRQARTSGARGTARLWQ